jgi:hypothetical protein
MENECTKRKVSNKSMKDRLYREKLESQMESAPGNIEIVDGYITRWMPEGERKGFISSIFSEYGRWAREQGGRFAVGNVGFTLGNNTRAPNAAYRRVGNIPPSNTRAHLLTQTQAPDWILETEFEYKSGAAETKILTHWLANGVHEAWLLVIPNPDIDVDPSPPVVPPSPLPIVAIIPVPPAAPYIAMYCSATHPNHHEFPDPLHPLQGYFAIDWHSEFQPPTWSLLSGAPPINCDYFMAELC